MLLIFVKYPEPGKVKTRLAENVGNDNAARIYSFIAKTVIRNVSKSTEYQTIIFFDSIERKNDIENWLGNDSHKFFPQQGESLGKRMAKAFEKAFSLGAEKAVIIGTDCIEISEEVISQAFNTVQTVDVVLGPAEDGGYYLLGLKKLLREIFYGIDWSTTRVLDQTLEKLKEKGLQFKLLETLRDVDTINDLNDDLLRKIQIEENN